MICPETFHTKHFPYCGRGNRTHSSDQLGITLHSDAENSIAALRVTVCYAFDLTG